MWKPKTHVKKIISPFEWPSTRLLVPRLVPLEREGSRSSPWNPTAHGSPRPQWNACVLNRDVLGCLGGESQNWKLFFDPIKRRPLSWEAFSTEFLYDTQCSKGSMLRMHLVTSSGLLDPISLPNCFATWASSAQGWESGLLLRTGENMYILVTHPHAKLTRQVNAHKFRTTATKCRRS